MVAGVQHVVLVDSPVQVIGLAARVLLDLTESGLEPKLAELVVDLLQIVLDP